MKTFDLEQISQKRGQELVDWAMDEWGRKIALACSFSPEDIVLAAMMKERFEEARFFALDTGRLHEETYECAEALRVRLGLNIEWYFPERAAVEKVEREKGLYSFRESIEARHECCRLRKVEPLQRALAGLEAWITGMRREQSVTRTEIHAIERDEAHGGLWKFNPLVDWTQEQVWAFIKERNLPYNRLHDQGFVSIGCAPCTRAIKPGEPPRAGRWWWESPEHKECGLHGRRKFSKA